jgi:hypothetical protein
MLARRAASFPFDPIFDQEREALVIGIPEATSVLSDTVQVFLEYVSTSTDWLIVPEMLTLDVC